MNTITSDIAFCQATKSGRVLFLSCRNLLLFFLLSFSGLFVSNAQTGGTIFPPADRCTSKDLELVNARLTGGDACNSCTQGTLLTRTLTLAINNKTGSTRTSFAFWGTLRITHQNGTYTDTAINRCSGPIPPTGPLPNAYTRDFGTVSYQCGDALRIINLYLAWTDASNNSTCASLNSATISPKCGTLPAIQINSGVNSILTALNPSCTALGSIQVAPFGGLPPYTITLGSTIRTNVTTTAIFTGLAPATYNIICTDANNCNASRSNTLVLTGSIDASRATVLQPTCTTATGTVTIQSPVNGFTYTLKQGEVLKYAANSSGVFESVISGNYVLFGTNGVCTSNGTDVTVNNQLITPDAPTILVTQPTCAATTATVTVQSPASGVTYQLKQGGVLKYIAANSGEFSLVAPGTYALIATNGVCTSAGSDVTVNSQPQTPPAPTICVVQPSLCGPVTGSVTILTPTGPGYEYSIDNGATWQSGTMFSNLTPGSVTGIKAKNDGCVSTASTCIDSSCAVNRVASELLVAPAEIRSTNTTVNFDAFPVPFKDLLTIKYKFDYKTDVKIEIFNAQGSSIFSQKDDNSFYDKEVTLDLNLKIDKQQLYIVKLTTNKGSSIKKIISK